MSTDLDKKFLVPYGHKALNPLQAYHKEQSGKNDRVLLIITNVHASKLGNSCFLSDARSYPMVYNCSMAAFFSVVLKATNTSGLHHFARIVLPHIDAD
jgi:hypothetical protein